MAQRFLSFVVKVLDFKAVVCGLKAFSGQRLDKTSYSPNSERVFDLSGKIKDNRGRGFGSAFHWLFLTVYCP